MPRQTTRSDSSDRDEGGLAAAQPQAWPERWWASYCRFTGLVGAAGVLLVCLDAAFGLRPRAGFSGDLDAIPYYASKSWTRQFTTDQDAIASAKVEYRPFTVWRRPPYASATVNVDADGRRTVPGSACADGVAKVFFFGGSTMWGTNSPDDGTIPALFVEEVRSLADGRLCVTNFGESAWVSTQSMIALATAIHRGDIPDLVVFYEGANDLTWTFGNDSAYGHAELDRIAATFNRAGRGRGQGRTRWIDAAGVVRSLAPNLFSLVDGRRQWGRGPSDRSPEGLRRLADEAMDVYFANQRIVRGMAHEYGFRCHFFWQPYLIYGRKPPATGEARMLAAAQGWTESFRPFAAAANDRVGQVRHTDFTDLSEVFAKTTDQLYTDMVHVTPEGNAMVARAMLEALRTTLDAICAAR